MTQEQIHQLLQKYNNGEYSQAELEQVEQCLENGLIELHQLEDIKELDQQLDELVEYGVSFNMRNAFKQVMQLEEVQQPEPWYHKIHRIWSTTPAYGLAASVVIFVFGLLMGNLFFSDSANNQEIASLSNQMDEMKEMMMLSMIDKESTSDRLKAVNMAQELPEASKQVTDALIKTLNTDDNINVRLAALDALFTYTGSPEVRTQLIKSISLQDSPLVQIALAEVMVALQEKGSVDQLKELLNKENVPPDVKTRIQEKIEILL